MRFATFIVAGALAVSANAQSTETPTTTATTTASTVVSLTPAQSSAAACLDACDPGDVNCTAKCIAVPNPSGAQVNATTECVANCDQGNGTAADNTNYANCVQTCIGQNYFTENGTPAETSAGGASSAAATGSATTTSGSSGSSGTGTASSSSASSTSTDTSAADAVRVGATGLSLLAMLAGFLAL